MRSRPGRRRSSSRWSRGGRGSRGRRGRWSSSGGRGAGHLLRLPRRAHLGVRARLLGEIRCGSLDEFRSNDRCGRWCAPRRDAGIGPRAPSTPISPRATLDRARGMSETARDEGAAASPSPQRARPGRVGGHVLEHEPRARSFASGAARRSDERPTSGQGRATRPSPVRRFVLE